MFCGINAERHTSQTRVIAGERKTWTQAWTPGWRATATGDVRSRLLPLVSICRAGKKSALRIPAQVSESMYSLDCLTANAWAWVTIATTLLFHNPIQTNYCRWLNCSVGCTARQNRIELLLIRVTKWSLLPGHIWGVRRCIMSSWKCEQMRRHTLHVWVNLEYHLIISLSGPPFLGVKCGDFWSPIGKLDCFSTKTIQKTYSAVAISKYNRIVLLNGGVSRFRRCFALLLPPSQSSNQGHKMSH